VNLILTPELRTKILNEWDTWDLEVAEYALEEGVGKMLWEVATQSETTSDPQEELLDLLLGAFPEKYKRG
jgi:hypothetical protein